MRFWRRWRGWIWGSSGDLLEGGFGKGWPGWQMLYRVQISWKSWHGGHDLALLAIPQ